MDFAVQLMDNTVLYIENYGAKLISPHQQNPYIFRKEILGASQSA